MTAVVSFPDVEQLVIGYLLDRLQDIDDDATVTTEVPNPRPARFVTVNRGGGPQKNLVADQPLVLLECWGPNDADGISKAHDLAAFARAHLRAMRHQIIAGVPIYRVDEVSGIERLPDPDSGQPRVVFTIQLLLRGSRP